MKYGKFICVVALMLAATLGTGLSAQRNVLQDVVYLKNGSIIRGLIVEQVPNESIKLQTNDGNIFVYNLDEVQKMTKEAGYAQRPAQRMGGSPISTAASNVPTGYKGFVDLGYNVGLGYYGIGYLHVSTTHGYQVVPDYLFIGGGIGVNWFVGYGDLTIPVFADFRSNFLRGRMATPFLDFKIGYAIGGGFYMSPSLGARIALGPKLGLNISAGYSLQALTVYDYDYGYMYRAGSSGLLFKVGLDF